jgi:uncharacterized protein involved in type VI secretion and phage assembly
MPHFRIKKRNRTVNMTNSSLENKISGSNGVSATVSGLYIGKVKQLSNDPLNECRILIELPAFEGDMNEQWARVATLYATTEAGSFFLPEPGNEVVVGFFNQDIRCPVILGSLNSNHQAPFYSYTQQNQKKAIVTREKLTIEFDEEKKSITILTPGKNMVEISDERKTIRLADQNRNELIMDSNGISISSNKDITLKSMGKIMLDAINKVSIISKSDIVLEGLNVNASAQVGLTCKGNATAEFSASGQTVVKGAIVMIN